LQIKKRKNSRGKRKAVVAGLPKPPTPKKTASFIIKVASSVSETECLTIVKDFLKNNYPNVTVRNRGQMKKLPCEIEIKNKKNFNKYSVPLGVVDIKEKNNWNFFYFTTNLKSLKEQDCSRYWEPLTVYCADSFKEPHSIENLEILFSQFKQQNIQQYLFHTFNLINLFYRLAAAAESQNNNIGNIINSLEKQFGSELIQPIFFPETTDAKKFQQVEIDEEEEYEPNVTKKVKSGERR